MPRVTPETELQVPRVHIKIQSVRHEELVRGNDVTQGFTIGMQIDRYIQQEREEGRFVNKLSLDLDPPEEPNPARMD